MGVWGVGMQENDTAGDVLDEFQEEFEKTAEGGGQASLLFKQVIREYGQDALAVLAMADALLDRGVDLGAGKALVNSYIKSELKPKVLSDWETPSARKSALLRFQKKLFRKPIKNAIQTPKIETKYQVGQRIRIKEDCKFREGLAPFEAEGRKPKEGFIDKTGRIVIPPVYDAVIYFSEGLAAVRVNELWGYIDKKGNMVIKPAFEDPHPFRKGRARVRFGSHGTGKYGSIDKRGRVVEEPLYSWVGDFSEGLAPVEADEKYGYIDRKKRLVIPLRYTWADRFRNGRAMIRFGLHPHAIWGWIDKKGRILLKTKFNQVEDFSEGLAKVVVDNKDGYIDISGKIVIKPQFDYAAGFAKGFARVQMGSKWGYIDKTGKLLAKPQFDECENFSDGMAAVMVKKKWGYINSNGELTIPFQFRTAQEFKKGKALVDVGTNPTLHKWRTIDKTGKFVG